MPLKKSAIYAQLWQSCNALRGGMDASQYKDYVLALLFVKYISDKFTGEYPPAGAVRISAPLWMSDERIRLFAIGKLAWIKQQRQKIQTQARETPREYLNQETHFVWGNPYLLRIVNHDAAPKVSLEHSELVMHVREGTTPQKMHELLEAWYRHILRKAALPRMAHWEKTLGLLPVTLCIRRMKTRWGTCTPTRHSILLNTELAKKPPERLEYLIVHELMHFLEPNHGTNFAARMDTHFPKWRTMKKRLNRLPVGYEEWDGENMCDSFFIKNIVVLP